MLALVFLFSAGQASAASITWTAYAAQSGSWTGVAYGNGTFVAVASGGQVMTSPDGTTWTLQTAAEGNAWKSIAYGNGIFVAVASSGSGTHWVMASPDGVTWTAQTAAENNAWQSVAYGNGIFVAVASGGTNRVMTSPDGATWTPISIGTDVWKAVTYGNGTFVAVSNRTKSMTSTDGSSWTLHDAMSNGSWNTVTYGSGLFVAGAGNQYINTSPDGATWANRSLPVGFSYPETAVAYGGGSFVIVSSNSFAGGVLVSSDGSSWSTQTIATGQALSAITHGNNIFVAVGGSTNHVLMGATVPAVTTNAASSLTTTSVTGNGTISADGTASSTVRGFVYGADTAYGATTTESGTFGIGDFTASIMSLTCGTTYHYAAYATNSVGTGYGSDAIFTTKDCSTSSSSDSNASSSGGGSLPWCSGPMAPGWNVSLPGGGCDPVASPILAATTTAQLAPTKSILCPHYHFTRTLRFGSTGEDVRALQEFLNCAGFTLTSSGAGSPGKETSVFADRTYNALVKFQEAYKSKILAPINSTNGTGIFAQYSRNEAYALMRPQ